MCLGGALENLSQTVQKDGDAMKSFLEEVVVSTGIVVASTVAAPIWATLTISTITYNQDVLASIFGFLVGIILVLTATLVRMK